ncbi:MAG: hypothetical protein AB1554_16365 [Chloroflexota bacterium]
MTGILQQDSSPAPLIQPIESIAAPPSVKKSNKVLWLGIGGGLLVVCLCVVLCLALGGTSLLKVWQEREPVTEVIDSFMRAMVERDTERAFALFSTRARRQIKIDSLEEMLAGNNYALFEGYQSVTIQNINITTGVNTNPDVPQGLVAKVDGIVTYSGGFTGSFNAVLEREGDHWALDAININIPPNKIQP